MIDAIWLALLAVLVYGIVKATSRDRYSNMSKEEFEREAKRSSRMGAAVAGLQKIIDPAHRAEYIQEQRERLEADGAESGDRPQTGRDVS